MILEIFLRAIIMLAGYALFQFLVSLGASESVSFFASATVVVILTRLVDFLDEPIRRKKP